MPGAQIAWQNAAQIIAAAAQPVASIGPLDRRVNHWQYAQIDFEKDHLGILDGDRKHTFRRFVYTFEQTRLPHCYRLPEYQVPGFPHQTVK